jgi:hypothetical protein
MLSHNHNEQQKNCRKMICSIPRLKKSGKLLIAIRFEVREYCVVAVA